MSSLNPIGTPFTELPTVESTNNYAMGLVRAGMAQHGAVVFTHEQTKGKGQRNKQWASERDKNIAMSIVIEPESLAPSQVFLLSMMAAVSVRDFFNSYATDDVTIKWPNDIYWCDRKAAGILIENLWKGSEWKFAVIGIGININQTHFGELNTKAVSLKQITGKDHDPLILAQELCGVIEKKYREMVHAPRQIADEYRSNLYKRGEWIKLKKDSRVFEALITDVDESGRLVVQHGAEERLEVGEVEWMISGE